MTFWDISDSLELKLLRKLLTGHTDSTTNTHSVESTVFTPDGRTLITTGDEKEVISWDVSDLAHANSSRRTAIGDIKMVAMVEFTPDRHTIATRNYIDQNVITLWDVGGPARSSPLNQLLVSNPAEVESLAFSPDGHTLASGISDLPDNMVILWDVSDPAHPSRVGQLNGYTSSVTSMGFSPDGRTLASADYNGSLVLWDVSDPAHPSRLGQPLTGYTGPVAFAPDSRTLVSKDGGAVALWDVSDPAHPSRLGQPLTGYTGPVAFAPDSRTLATLTFPDINPDNVFDNNPDNYTVALWDVSDPAHPSRLGQPLTGYTGPVAFAPDGRTLATRSAAGDNTVTLWDLTSLNNLRNHAVERACAISGGGLDRIEWGRYIPGLPYQDTCHA